MSVVKIAMAQFESAPEVEVNLGKMAALIRSASKNGASLIMFHELATTEYFCYDVENEANFALAEPVPGRSTDYILQVSRETGVAVLLPVYELHEGRRYNTVVYIDPGKGITGKYRKTHIPSLVQTVGTQKGGDESFYFAPGDTGFVLPAALEGVSIGSVICYDRHFPESGRSYALQGAHLLYIPTATYRSFIVDEMWKSELQTYAFQNSVYVVGVNKVGPVVGETITDGSRYPGISVIYDPLGRLVAEAGTGEEIVYADIDTQLAEETKALGPMKIFESRRPEMYGTLVK